MVMPIPKTPAYKYILKSLAPKIPKLGETAEQSDPTAWVKLFTPDGGWTWYIIEYDPKDRIAYGLVKGFVTEYGSFSLDEIEELRGNVNVRIEDKDYKSKDVLRVERDLYFKPTPVKQLLPEA